MEDKVLAALVDLQIALGKLQSFAAEVEQAVRKLMAVQLEYLESKREHLSDHGVEDKKEGSTTE